MGQLVQIQKMLCVLLNQQDYGYSNEPTDTLLLVTAFIEKMSPYEIVLMGLGAKKRSYTMRHKKTKKVIDLS